MSDSFCSEATKSGTGCLQPERWLVERLVFVIADNAAKVVSRRVCQSHARVLVKAGWAPVRELHPVAGYERTAP